MSQREKKNRELRKKFTEFKITKNAYEDIFLLMTFGIISRTGQLNIRVTQENHVNVPLVIVWCSIKSKK